MNEMLAFWCGVGIGVIVTIIAAMIAGAIWFYRLAKPSEYIPSLRHDPVNRERKLRPSRIIPKQKGEA